MTDVLKRKQRTFGILGALEFTARIGRVNRPSMFGILGARVLHNGLWRESSFIVMPSPGLCREFAEIRRRDSKSTEQGRTSARHNTDGCEYRALGMEALFELADADELESAYRERPSNLDKTGRHIYDRAHSPFSRRSVDRTR